MGMIPTWKCGKCGAAVQQEAMPPQAGCPGQQGTGSASGSGTGATQATQNHVWQQTAG